MADKRLIPKWQINQRGSVRHGIIGESVFEDGKGVDALQSKRTQGHDGRPGGTVEMMKRLQAGDQRNHFTLTTRLVGLQQRGVAQICASVKWGGWGGGCGYRRR